MKFYTIYRIYCTLSKKCYVGVTSNRAARKSDHFSKLRKNTHYNIKLQNAYNKYGRRAFKWQIIESKLSKDEAFERESAWIDFYDSYRNGYNMSKGGVDGGDNSSPCTWNDINYPSIRAAALDNGITPECMRMRFVRGFKSDSDLGNRGKLCEWNGVKYKSIRAAAKDLGISENTMRKRLKNGFTKDADLDSSHKSTRITWNGIVYESMHRAANELGVSVMTVSYRHEKGYKCDDDMVGCGADRAQSITWNDVIYKSIGSAAVANGVTRPTMWYRVKQGYICDEDIELAARYKSKTKQWTWNGVPYRTVRDCADAIGVEEKLVRHWVIEGYTCADDLHK